MAENKNITTKLTIDKALQLINENYAKKSAIPKKVGDLTNDQNFQTKSEVDAAIASKIGSAYKAGGSIADPGADSWGKLVEANEGFVYNVSAQFTTDATHFVDGVDKKYPAGTNIVVVNDNGTYKYDVLSGFVDLEGYIEKVKNPTAGNFAGVDASGNLVDSGKKASDFVAAEDGKRLMTTAEGEKLNGIQEGATKVEKGTSEGDGTIKINGVVYRVYTLPDDVLTEDDIEDYTESEIKSLLGITE